MLYSTPSWRWRQTRDVQAQTMASGKRELFKAPEVCQMAQLQSYVLRSWEAEFPRLGKVSSNGVRVYSRADVELVLRIKQLVFVEGLTLAGARRRLDEEAEGTPNALAGLTVEEALGDLAKTRLKQIRRGLEGILALLGPADDRPQLELVAPSAEPSRRRTAPRSAGDRASAAGSRAVHKATSGKRRRVSA